MQADPDFAVKSFIDRYAALEGPTETIARSNGEYGGLSYVPVEPAGSSTSLPVATVQRCARGLLSAYETRTLATQELERICSRLAESTATGTALRACLEWIAAEAELLESRLISPHDESPTIASVLGQIVRGDFTPPTR